MTATICDLYGSSSRVESSGEARRGEAETARRRVIFSFDGWFLGLGWILTHLYNVSRNSKWYLNLICKQYCLVALRRYTPAFSTKSE
jgi:hypothetical protein